MTERRQRRRAWVARNAVTLAVAAVALLALVLGTVGFQVNRHQGGRHLADSAYRAAQLLVLNFDVNFLPKPKPNGWVSVARWLGAATAFAVVLTLLFRPLALRLRLAWQSIRPKNRVILLGFGAINRAIALNLPGKAITAIDKSFDVPARRLAAERGILLVEADLGDDDVHRAVKIAWSDSIYVACGSDQVNLEAGHLVDQLIREANRRGAPDRERILVHLSDISLMRDLADAHDVEAGRGAPFLRFSLKEVAAQDLLRRIRLPQRAAEAGHRRVHAVIFGGGDQGEALLREIAAVGHSAATTSPPIITVLDSDAARIEARARAAYKTLFSTLLPDEACPDIRFLPAEFTALDPEYGALADLQQGRDLPTAYLVTTGDDTLNLRVGMRLEAAMQRRLLRPAPIYVRSWDNLTIPGRDRVHPLLHLAFFGDVRLSAKHWLGGGGSPRHWLRLNHTYEKRVVTDAGRSAEELWKALAGLYRRSNLRAAQHATSKLLDLGLHWRGMADGVLPAITPEVRRSFENAIGAGLPAERPAAAGATATLWDAARAEHARWIVDRALEGFRPTEPHSPDPTRRNRSDLLRRHPLLVPFADVPGPTRALDLDVLDMLLQPGGAANPAWRRLTHPIRLSALPTAIPDGADAPTELELEIDWPENGEIVSPYAADADALAAARALIQRWAANPRSCRLHLKLREPSRFPRKIEPAHFRALDALLSDLPSDIARDVTWLPRT